MKKRILCMLLAILMIVGIFPANVFAEDTETTALAETTVVTEQSVSTEVTETTAGTTAATESQPDFSGSIGMQAVFDVETWTYFIISADPAQTNEETWADTELALEVIADDLVMVITDWVIDDGSRLWYKVEAAEGCTLPEVLAQNPWVFQDYTDDNSAGDSLILSEAPEETPTDPTETEPEGSEPEETQSTELEKTTESGNQVGVSGVLPEGTTLAVSDVTVNAADYGIADASSILAALDIRLLDADGALYQPYTDEGEVQVTIDARNLGLSDGDIVTLHHNHEGTITKYDPYVVIGGKLTFWTDKFSVYVVSGLRKVEYSTEITADATYTMKVGEKRVFWGDYPGNRAVWQVTDTSSAISYTLVGLYEDTQSWAQWIEVEAKDVGKVTLTFTVYGGTSHTFYLDIVAPDGLYIDDNAAESGCLVPTWSDADFDATGVKYTWSRSDGLAIRTEALNSDGSVNISIDRGGVTNSRDPITYTVVATNTEGTEIGTASFEVLYGNEILNPSFEQPGNFSSGYRTYYNGYPGLYWKTTAPGEGGNLLKDIEVGHESGNPYGIGEAADGSFYAELNAENFGALYQDLLTTPNAELTWSFGHTKRADSGRNDIMYVVIASTEYAQTIINKDNIAALLTAAKEQASANDMEIPLNSEAYPEGFEFTYHGGTYRIWKSVADTTAKTAARWKKVTGAYRVPQGQYLTRLFFASETDGGNSTLGNMIDAAYAGEIMTYRVEYYVSGELQDTYTETGEATLYSMTAISNLEAVKGQNLQITGVTVNGLDYPGDINNGLFIRDYGGTVDEEDGIVCKIYLDNLAVTITKVVEVEGWDTMNAEQQAAVLGEDGLTSSFQLYDEDGKAETSSVTIIAESAMGKLTAMTSFTGLDYGTYTLKETAYEDIPGYRVTTSYSGGTAAGDGVSVTLSKNNLFEAVVCTNRYDRISGDLQVTKFVDKEFFADPAAIDSDKTFDFTVTFSGIDGWVLPTDYKYTIKKLVDSALPSENDTVSATGRITINDGKMTFSLKDKEYILIEDLPACAYTIEEADYTDDGFLKPIYYQESDTITENGTTDVSCYNTMVRSTGDLQLKKTVVNAGNGDVPQMDFEFTVVLTNLPSTVTEGSTFKAVYTDSTGAEITSYVDANNQTVQLPTTVQIGLGELDGEYTFTLMLRGGWTVTIEDLPACAYLVSEPVYDKFSASWNGTNVGVIGGGQTAAAECTNTYNVTVGNLRIEKLLKQESSLDTVPEDTYTVKVEFKSNGTAVAGEFAYVTCELDDTDVEKPADVTSLPKIQSGGILTLKKNQAVVIFDLPICDFTVTETAAANGLELYTVKYITSRANGGRIKAGDTVVLGVENTYKRHLTKLTIQKAGAEAIDENQSFVFRVQSTDLVYENDSAIDMRVVVTGNNAVTLSNLPVGTYTITEESGWSWRYVFAEASGSDTGDVSESDGVITVVLDDAGETVTVTNDREKIYWLNGADAEKNIFDGSN